MRDVSDEILASLAAHMSDVVDAWLSGQESRPLERAFALGRMMGIVTAADRIEPGQTAVLLPRWWREWCDLLEV